MLAANKGDAGIMESLLKAGANIHIKNKVPEFSFLASAAADVFCCVLLCFVVYYSDPGEQADWSQCIDGSSSWN